MCIIPSRRVYYITNFFIHDSVVPQMKPHPLGVLPTGNTFLDDEYSRTKSMGMLGLLNDELLMVVLQDLPPKDLLNVGYTCKALYAYASFDELWKHHVYANPPSKWFGSWRSTYLSRQGPRIDATGKVYSDFLHRPWELSQIQYNKIITSTDKNLLPLYQEQEMTPGKFDEFGYTSPFMVQLSNPVARWTADDLKKEFGDVVFQQEYMDWPLSLYVDFMRNNDDETPLYLFDCRSEAHSRLAWQPPCPHLFGRDRDYFTLLENKRPDHRWLIIGPPRSGSKFHKDPNATSAWNAVISGHKYWIFFPPSSPPPGVTTDADQGEVTSPLSLAEWFASGFYEDALERPDFKHAIQKPGQCMYVPSGWWHCVVNLDECVALTGNFVAEPQLRTVLKFLRDKPDQISGFSEDVDAFSLFYDAVRTRKPDLVEKRRKRHWTDVVHTDNDQPFSFGFA